MGIKKSLAPREISRNEALTEYIVYTAPEGAVDRLKQSQWRAMRFAHSFRSAGIWNRMLGRVNDYSKAAGSIAYKAEVAGLAACDDDCGVQVAIQDRTGENVETICRLAAICGADDCRETGLKAIEVFYDQLALDADKTMDAFPVDLSSQFKNNNVK